MSILDSIIENTGNGPNVVRRQDDKSQINWQRGAGDIAEAIKMGRDMVETANSRASLATVDGQVAVIYTTESDAWHELGTMVDQAMSLEDVFRLCPALDFTVDKEPVFVEIAGVPTLVPSVYAVMRISKSGERVPFSNVSVGERMELVQPRESLAYLDEALGKAGAHYETAGAIEDGKKIFVSARMPQWVEPVPRDEVHHFMSLTDAFDGSETGRWFSCENRMVCRNTRRLAMEGGRDFHRFRHTASIQSKMRAAARAFEASQRGWADYAEKAVAMPAVQCNPQHFASDVLDAVLDITAADCKKGASALASALDVTQAERDLAEKRFDRKIRRRESILGEILDRYESETNTARGSVWGAYNAVTEYANHGLRYKGSATKRAESRLDSVLSGRADQINQVAYNQAVELVKAN